MTNVDLKNELIKYFEELGFPLCGVSSPELNPASLSMMKSWLQSGYHADMDYLAKRRDIEVGAKAVLPDVKSVIIVGLPYKHPKTISENGPRGLVSMYASGRDYHRIFEKRFKKIKNKMLTYGDSPRCYVDYGPVMERAYAVQSGLGFIGKNCCLINPQYGSYLFLGVILSTLDLPFDEPMKDSCEKCDRCQQACPTGALTSRNMVDSNKCISYQTIENKNNIPEELRPKIGRWILGCDRCQMACPHNKDVLFTACEDFINTRLENSCELMQFFDYDKESFKDKFQGTAAMRPGLNGMKRNAAIALGNSKNKDLMPILERKLATETNSDIASYIKWAIDTINK